MNAQRLIWKFWAMVAGLALMQALIWGPTWAGWRWAMAAGFCIAAAWSNFYHRR